jgi:hypothetical protein
MAGGNWRSVVGFGLALTLLMPTTGCSGKKKWAYNEQVEGTLKLGETPLPGVLVQFYPDVDPNVQAPPSSGLTDEKGHFQLKVDSQDKPGAVIGKHNVVVLPGRSGGGEEGGAARRTARVPSAYTLAATTPLQQEVTADKHTYDLKLISSAQPRK